MSESASTDLGNALIVTHYDLDGFVSALCLLEAFNLPKNRVRFLSYGVNRSRIIRHAVRETRADTVVLCDIGLSEDDLAEEWVRDRSIRRIIFDHHDSTAQLDLSAFHESIVNTSDEVCCADLIYDYLERIGRTQAHWKLKPWVRLAHDRDLWLNHDRQTAQRVSWLLKERILDRLDTALMTPSPDEFLRQLNGQWRRGEALFWDAVRAAENTAHTFHDAPVPIKIAYVKRDTSDVAEELQEGGQLIVLLNLFGQEIGVSLRVDKETEIDVAEIARRCFRGGGHRKAASGFVETELLIGGYRAIRDRIVPVLEEQIARREGASEAAQE